MKNLLLVLCFVSPLAFAGDSEGHRDAEAICKYIGGADTIIRCNKTVSEAKTLQKEAVAVCKYIGGSDKIIECLTAIRNRTFSESALSTCKYIGGSDKIIECFKSTGTEVAAASKKEDDGTDSVRNLIKKALRQMEDGNYGKARETLQRALER